MRRFAGRGNRTAEQSLVDENADDRFLTSAVGRHHEIEQKPRRTRSARQPAGVDDGDKISSTVHLSLGRRYRELVEGHAIGG